MDSTLSCCCYASGVQHWLISPFRTLQCYWDHVSDFLNISLLVSSLLYHHYIILMAKNTAGSTCVMFYPGRKNTRAEVGCSLISYSWIVSVLCFLLRDWYDVYVQKTLAIIPQHHCHTLPNTLTHSSVRGLLIYAWIDFLIYICFVF